ncbi:MAG: MnmC family methyltransferase [Planctomycetota bacterium]|nr:MnmC family methyltransferase [Planctomycetota bacterium]
MAEPAILTADGSPTRYHPDYQQHYHSLSGAHMEARLRYVVPGRIIETARQRGQVRILDVGFGLGTNVAWAIHELQKQVPGAELEIVSIEREILPVAALVCHFKAYPEMRLAVLLREMVEKGESRDRNLRLQLRLGEAENEIETIDGPFHAVFLDPFSPASNPEPWKSSFLAAIRKRTAQGGILTTYSSARSVRLALLEAGWQIGEGPAVGTKSSGTVASSGSVTPPLPPIAEKLNRKLQRLLETGTEGEDR